MKPKNAGLRLKYLSLSVALGLLTVPSLPTRIQAGVEPSHPNAPSLRGVRSWEISQAFTPPNRSAPTSTAAGGARSDCVISDKDSVLITALLPGNSLPLTVTDQPTFYVYVPRTKAKTVEFLLRDDQDNEVYRTSLPVPTTAGIVGVQLPLNGNKTYLEAGKDYRWLFALVCKPNDRREDVFVDGWVQRTNPSEELKKALENMKDPEKIPGVYANASIWYDALHKQAELRRQRPNDPAIAANWTALLKSVGLDAMVDKPLVH